MHCENLSCELIDKKQEVKLLLDVESQLNDLKLELETVNGRLKNTSLELGKSQTKNKSLVKHEQVKPHLNEQFFLETFSCQFIFSSIG